MNRTHLVAVAIVALAATGTALAQDKALTRAEVLADMQVWRESGLANLEPQRREGIHRSEYYAAQARYHELRASPRYAQLVEQFSRDAASTGTRP